MKSNLILIYDKRFEISNKYKKILEQNHAATVKITTDKNSFFEILVNQEPDLLLISESTQENLTDICQAIRDKNLPFRPIIILLSKSSFADDKTNALNAGADDFLSEPILQEEFLARINAHIRRSMEENETEQLKLPNLYYSKKIIRRTIKYGSNWAMLLIGFDNLPAYKEIYGQVAANKVIQAYNAILSATVDYDDFIGQLSPDNFLVITSSYKAEKLADYLNYAMDSIAEKFYSHDDAKRGYILLNGSKKSGCKIPLIKTSIGIIDSEYINYLNEKEVINALTKVQKLAKLLSGSSKIIDRPLITGESANILNSKQVVVIEKDTDLAYLLETTLKLQGFEPTIFNEIPSEKAVLDKSPIMIIIDNCDDEHLSAERFCKGIKEKAIQNLKIIFTDNNREKEEILSAGADLYLPKPYELTELFSWIYKLLD